ncbi:MAG: hypothetical protein LW721_12895 [Flammeovirgaceae bacterium]|jgi:hypothetical protein|nr:hypothetical protein [Flammeovirgaceae bacterium]
MEIKETRTTNEIEEITRLIALVTLIVIVFGYGSLSLYYYKWGISISSYVDASEILLAFTSYFYEILLSLILCFFYFGALVITHHWGKKAKTGEESSDSPVISQSIQKKRKVFLVLSKVVYFVDKLLPFLFIVLYIFILSIHNSRNEDRIIEILGKRDFALEYAAVFLLLPIGAIFLFYRAYFIKENLNKFFRIGFLVFGSIYFYQMIDLKYILTKNEILTKDVELVLDNGKMINTKTDSLIFIGSTRAYLFFSEKTKQRAGKIRIIPFARVYEHKISR